MSSNAHIEFVRHLSRSRLHSPLQGYEEVESQTELRRDPLTGRTAVVGLNLAGKRTILYSETDEELLSSLVDRTREGCFFCPERVEGVTPRYPEGVLPGTDGRLRRGGSILFPNLFPLTDFHAVVALGREHYLPLDGFAPELMAEGLSLAVEFVRSASKTENAPPHWTVCSNYLPPGGASIIHPHFQILGSQLPMTTPDLELQKALAYTERHGTCYFDDLVALERESGERFIGREGPVSWLTPFAPRGNNEIMGICDEASDLTRLTDAHVEGLARGLSRGLACYHGLKMSTFNFALYSAPTGQAKDAFRVFLSMVTRQSVVENYRCDDYFLQKMLGAEILVDSPERIASLVRGVR